MRVITTPIDLPPTLVLPNSSPLLFSLLTTQGLIFLDAKCAILHEQLRPRLLEGKREACDIAFADFDDVKFRIVSSPECPNIVKVNMFTRAAKELKAMGSKELLERLFPGQETTPDPEYSVAIEFDCDRIVDPPAFLERVSLLKRHMMCGPMYKAFTALQAKKSEGMPVMRIDYRQGESIFVCPSATKVVVIFLVDFSDLTDKALAKVFMQEFMEAKRTVTNAPPVSYFPREPPAELASMASSLRLGADTVGFISFALEERHVLGERLENSMTLLAGFRNYLHYHIKASKTYLHMRMRKRVAGWLQVLNRAIPERAAGDKEMKTITGKTFTRK